MAEGWRGLDINSQSLLRNPKVFCRRSLTESYMDIFITSISKWQDYNSYNRIDRIIMAKIDYMENWNYILFGYPVLSLTLNLIK